MAPMTPAIGSTIADNCPYIKLLVRLAPARRKGMATAKPSGKFWIPIPMAKAMAPAIVAPSMPLAAAPNKTPTASPSGMLCSVIASTNNVVLCSCVLTPSVSFS